MIQTEKLVKEIRELLIDRDKVTIVTISDKIDDIRSVCAYCSSVMYDFNSDCHNFSRGVLFKDIKEIL